MARLLGAARPLIACLVLAMAVGTAGAAEYEIVMNRLKFGKPPPGLRVGDVIVWRNDDILRHTATARDGSFDIDLPPKTRQSMTLDRAGVIDYYCRFHPGMVGRLDVQK